VLATNVLAATNIVATLGHVVNDGAVFYLNGTELMRVNMPAGPITYATMASAGNANVCNTGQFPVAHLLSRTNVLAVEVHQAGNPVTTDFVAAFDASFSLQYLRYPTLAQPNTNNVRIRTTNHSPTHVSVYFTNGFGYTLESKTNLTDPAWQEVQPATNRLITPKTNPRKFYRLHKVH
jgi:hypothetical protein